MKVIKERIEALEQRTHTLETTVHEQSESLKGLESTGDRNVVQLKEEIRKLQNTQLEVRASFKITESLFDFLSPNL